LFEYIQGILQEATTEKAVVDANGVGYEIFIPASSFNALPKTGETVKLFIHFHVREDTQKFFGFATRGERDVFRQLISINQVGPKVAINVLSGLSVKDIVYSVQTQDSSKFKAISGIGPKTAQRLILELKGKLDIKDVDRADPVRKTGSEAKPDISLRHDVFAAMISLGYNESQVIGAVARVEQVIEKDAPIEEWIKKALQVI